MDVDRIGGYVSGCVVDCSAGRAISIERLPGGNRHEVYKVSCLADDLHVVVVRVSLTNDAAESAQAEREAAVLRVLDGVSAPLLYDQRSESVWFDNPVMCLQFVEGEHRDVVSVAPEDVERLGAVVAAVHNLSTESLIEWFPGAASTLDGYVSERLDMNASYLPRLGDRLPGSVRLRVHAAFALVSESLDQVTASESFLGDKGMVLLHGDVAGGNILWAQDPVLIDWEYARLGDPADEIAYIFGQHTLPPRQREAFWTGYGNVSTYPALEHLVERAGWWEPVLLLGSALWWLERWSWRVDADAAGLVDPGAPKPQSYYLDEANRRLSAFDQAVRGDW